MMILPWKMIILLLKHDDSSIETWWFFNGKWWFFYWYMILCDRRLRCRRKVFIFCWNGRVFVLYSISSPLVVVANVGFATATATVIPMQQPAVVSFIHKWRFFNGKCRFFNRKWFFYWNVRTLCDRQPRLRWCETFTTFHHLFSPIFITFSSSFVSFWSRDHVFCLVLFERSI